MKKCSIRISVLSIAFSVMFFGCLIRNKGRDAGWGETIGFFYLLATGPSNRQEEPVAAHLKSKGRTEDKNVYSGK